MLTDVIAEWPAATKWKLDYFAQTHGDLEIVADDGTREKLRLPMSEYVANFEEYSKRSEADPATHGPPPYLRTWNFYNDVPELLNDFVGDSPYFRDYFKTLKSSWRGDTGGTRPSVHRSIGPSVQSVHRSNRSIGPSVHRSIGPLVHRSIGPIGPLVHRSIRTHSRTCKPSLELFPRRSLDLFRALGSALVRLSYHRCIGPSPQHHHRSNPPHAYSNHRRVCSICTTHPTVWSLSPFVGPYIGPSVHSARGIVYMYRSRLNRVINRKKSIEQLNGETRMARRPDEPPDGGQPPFTWLFLGPRGCQTRLHVDVWHTDAWLCMLEGRKKFVMYHPAHLKHIFDEAGVVPSPIASHWLVRVCDRVPLARSRLRSRAIGSFARLNSTYIYLPRIRGGLSEVLYTAWFIYGLGT